jgi:hypothetical protein
LLVLLFKQIRAHYVFTAKKLFSAALRDRSPVGKVKHTAIVPVSGIHPGVFESVRYALSISNDPRACYVNLNPEATIKLREQWRKLLPDVPLIVLESPYRSMIGAVLEYIRKVENEEQDDIVTVIIPEFMTERWYHKFLHNQSAILLYAALRGERRIVVTSVRYHLG